MNLHIMPDSIYTMKFIEFIRKHFNTNAHYFIIVTNLKELNYVKTSDMSGIYILYLDSLFNKLNCLNNKELKELMSKCSRIFIHYLSTPSSFIVLRYTDFTQKLIWVTWGGDIYDVITGVELLENETKDLIKLQQVTKAIINKLKDLIIRRPIKKVFISRLNYIAVDFRDEFDLIRSNLNTNAVYKEYHYPSPIDFHTLDATKLGDYRTIEGLLNSTNFEKLILVGNSGDVANNHISVLKLLKDIEFHDFGIVCPLSYGNFNYINCVIRLGRELFGERFIPITNFLEPEAYYQLLNKIDVAIMNHYRQQGKGNITPLIYLGKKVYIREKVTTYTTYRSMGIRLESTDQLFIDGIKGIFIPYSNQDVMENRDIILKIYSEEEDLKKMTDLFIAP